MDLRDPKHRIRVTFPGKPVTVMVSPEDIEAYLLTKGYQTLRSVERDWPASIPYAFDKPDATGWGPVIVHTPRDCCRPIDATIEDIAKSEQRSPGEILQEIETHALLRLRVDEMAEKKSQP